MAFFSPSSLKKNVKSKLSFRKRPKKHFLLNVGFVLLMLGLMTFAVYQCVQHMTVGLDTLRTQEITEQSYVDLQLFVFRDERILPAGGDVVAYHVTDGEKVGVGKTLATAYTCPEGQDPVTVQVQLTSLARRMAAMQSPVGQDSPTQGDELKGAVNRDYLAFLSATQRGDLEEAAALAQRMEDYLNAYQTLMDGGHASETLKTLEGIKNSLVQTMTATSALKTDKGGYFYYDIDGYEVLFDADDVMTMTPEEFLTLTQASAQTTDVPVAGKMVYTATWYAAAYVSLADVSAFQERVGDDFEMVTSDGTGTKLPMTLVRMEPATDGALLVFKSQAMPSGFDFSRSFSVSLLTSSVGGYRVPEEALVTLNTKQGEVTGVYVLEGNVVEFRKIMRKASYDGYVVAVTYADVQGIMESLDEEQREQMTADGYAYLNLNDRIITRGTGLYEGKIVG